MKKLIVVFFIISTLIAYISSNQKKNEYDYSFCDKVPDFIANFKIENDRNEELLDKARYKEDGSGGVCDGAVYKVTEPLVVYRVYDKNKPEYAIGSWWTKESPFDPPINSERDYRNAYAVCKEWPKKQITDLPRKSILNAVVECKIKVGQLVVIGTTQSAYCENNEPGYSKTHHLQLYISELGAINHDECNFHNNWPPHKQ